MMKSTAAPVSSKKLRAWSCLQALNDYGRYVGRDFGRACSIYFSVSFCTRQFMS